MTYSMSNGSMILGGRSVLEETFGTQRDPRIRLDSDDNYFLTHNCTFSFYPPLNIGSFVREQGARFSGIPGTSPFSSDLQT